MIARRRFTLCIIRIRNFLPHQNVLFGPLFLASLGKPAFLRAVLVRDKFFFDF